VEGKTYLLDVFLATGTISSRGKFTRHFEPAYFLTDPEQFAFFHHPSRPAHQLLAQPWTPREFQQAARFVPYPWLQWNGPRTRTLSKGKLHSFRIEVPYVQNVRILATGKKTAQVNLSRNGTDYKGSITPESGMKEVELVLETAPGVYRTVATFSVR
jgi:hypothetical protein